MRFYITIVVLPFDNCGFPWVLSVSQVSYDFFLGNDIVRSKQSERQPRRRAPGVAGGIATGPVEGLVVGQGVVSPPKMGL